MVAVTLRCHAFPMSRNLSKTVVKSKRDCHCDSVTSIERDITGDIYPGVTSCRGSFGVCFSLKGEQ